MPMENIAGKNRPVATNFQFLIILFVHFKIALRMITYRASIVFFAFPGCLPFYFSE